MRNRFARFLLVGGLATALQYALLIVFVELWHWNAVVASSIGYILSAIANYLLNRRFTFASDMPHHIAASRFAIAAAAGLCLNGLLMALLTQGWNLPYVWAQILATCATLLWNFWANANWSFARKPARPAPHA